MNRNTYIRAGLAALSAAPAVYSTAQTAARPNIIMILVDDMGFSDSSPYGATDLHTPNLDRLAQEGIRFRQFYNNAISAPTRASVITGQYQHRAGIGYFDVDLGDPAYQGYLNQSSLTFGEVLQQAGYSTFVSGKWNVGQKREYWPRQRGFDRAFGFLYARNPYFNDGRKAEGDSNVLGRGLVQELWLDNEPYESPEGKYLTDDITDHALQFIDDQQHETKGKKPFFLYLPFNAPHAPLHALPEDIARYEGVYAIGWDSLRQRRFDNAKSLGLIKANTRLAPHDDGIQRWGELTYYEKLYWQKREEVFAAMIDRVDQSIGRLLAKLKELGQDENTLIVFCSDNGAQGGSRLRDEGSDGPIGAPGTYYIPLGHWSQAGNSPLREYKARPYEGGISSPFIAWYPGKIKGGQIVDGIGHIIDLAPTFYELAGAKYPKKYKGVKTYALPGKSLLPVLTGQCDVVDRGAPLFWEWAGNRAVRDGKWKLVSIYPEKRTELYDIEADRGETTDVSSQHPDIVTRLLQQWEQWAAQNDVKDFEQFSELTRKNRQAILSRK